MTIQELLDTDIEQINFIENAENIISAFQEGLCQEVEQYHELGKICLGFMVAHEEAKAVKTCERFHGNA